MATTSTSGLNKIAQAASRLGGDKAEMRDANGGSCAMSGRGA
jgi:hypothetical protein